MAHLDHDVKHLGDDVIASYEFDYDKIVEFQTDLAFSNDLLAIPLTGGLCCPLICCAWNPCCGWQKANIYDAVNARHVELTNDGIRYTVEQHKTGCRLDCQTQGRVTRLVSYNMINDVQVNEPAGASGPCCCMTKNVLTEINIDANTAQADVDLRGLKDPAAFRAKVIEMKRRHTPGANTSGITPAVAFSADPAVQAEVFAMLQEQNKVLKSIDQSLKTMKL